VRQLYSDADEALFDACRPVLLNGIEDFVERPDLADRAILLTLKAIPEEQRQPEVAIWAAFEKERPRILGALLDAASHGLRHLPETRLQKLPRMADFAIWATACEEALWPAGTFMSAYSGNLMAAIDEVIEADPVASAVLVLIETRTEWTGTASELLGALGDVAGEKITKSKSWPPSPKALSGRLRRAGTFLRKKGVEITFDREGHARTRTISIAADRAGKIASASSAPSASGIDANKTNELDRAALWTKKGPADTSCVRDAEFASAMRPQDPPSVRAKSLKNNGATRSGDGADRADAKIPNSSAAGDENGMWEIRL
jgi:hypothetical protein